MNEIAKLGIEDFFIWGIWQKINSTGNRKITLKEIEDFADIVSKEAKKIDIEVKCNFSRNETQKFINEYGDFITYDGDYYKLNYLKLNDNISYEQSLDLFHMGVINYKLVKILTDKKIGQTIFNNKNKQEELSPV